MSCMWIKDDFHFKFNSGKFIGLPTKLPSISIFVSSALPTLSVLEVVDSLICLAKFPWATHGQPTPLPTELPTNFIFGSRGLPTEHMSCPLSPYMESSGQPNLHGKISMGSPWAALSTAHWAAHYCHIWKQWAATELPTVSIYRYGSSGQPNLHGKIPMGSPLTTQYVQPKDSEVGSSLFFPYGMFPTMGFVHHFCFWILGITFRSLPILFCLRITDECSIPKMRIWFILLILKLVYHSDRSLWFLLARTTR